MAFSFPPVSPHSAPSPLSARWERVTYNVEHGWCKLTGLSLLSPSPHHQIKPLGWKINIFSVLLGCANLLSNELFKISLQDGVGTLISPYLSQLEISSHLQILLSVKCHFLVLMGTSLITSGVEIFFLPFDCSLFGFLSLRIVSSLPLHV